MHFKALLDQLLDFLAQCCIVIPDFVSKQRQNDFGLVLPKQVLLTDQEVEELGEKVVNAVLECRVLAFRQLDRGPLKDYVDALHELLRLRLDQSQQFIDNFQVLLEVSRPHERGHFFSKDLLSVLLDSTHVRWLEIVRHPFRFGVNCGSTLLVSRVDTEWLLLWLLNATLQRWFACRCNLSGWTCGFGRASLGLFIIATASSRGGCFRGKTWL